MRVFFHRETDGSVYLGRCWHCTYMNMNECPRECVFPSINRGRTHMLCRPSSLSLSFPLTDPPFTNTVITFQTNTYCSLWGQNVLSANLLNLRIVKTSANQFWLSSGSSDHVNECHWKDLISIDVLLLGCTGYLSLVGWGKVSFEVSPLLRCLVMSPAPPYSLLWSDPALFLSSSSSSLWQFSLGPHRGSERRFLLLGAL